MNNWQVILNTILDSNISKRNPLRETWYTGQRKAQCLKEDNRLRSNCNISSVKMYFYLLTIDLIALYLQQLPMAMYNELSSTILNKSGICFTNLSKQCLSVHKISKVRSSFIHNFHLFWKCMNLVWMQSKKSQLLLLAAK